MRHAIVCEIFTVPLLSNNIANNEKHVLPYISDLTFSTLFKLQAFIRIKNYTSLCFAIVLYCGRVPAANVPGCTAAEGLLVFSRSYLHR